MSPMDITKFEKLKASGSLPSPKGVALAIMRLTQKEDASMAELARIIKSDPAFVGRLIKAANSVNANPGRPVVSVQEALVVLGMPAVRNLALGFSLLSQFKKGACKGFEYQDFWAASLACGIALQALTLRTRAAQAEEAFSVGLLARVGELALATMFADEYAAILRTLAKSPEADLVGLECEHFAMNHRELSAAMLSDWGLPKIFCEAVQDHEDSDGSRYREGGREDVLLQSLALSRHIAEICIAAEEERTARMPRLFALGARVSIEKEDLKSLCDNVVRDWKEWTSILSLASPAVPSFEDLDKPQPGREPPAADAGAPSRLRILVADENGADRAALRAALEQDGYEVIEAGNGQEGMGAALAGEPHMMVVNRNLPLMSGVELTRSLRDTPLGRGMYVLMLTTTDGDDELIEGLENGVDDHLAKPFNKRLLLARLRGGQRIVRLHQEMEHDREVLNRFAAELAVSNRRLQEAALTDVLTGFPNRRYAMERIEQEWAASSRNRRPLACMVIDLDQFKQVNDTHGHDVGDMALRQAAATLRGALRAQDLICRTGGDEFLVLCPDTDLKAAMLVAERLRVAVQASPVETGGPQIFLTASVGVAMRVPAMGSVDALIKCADDSVYRAKQRGRNCIAALQLQSGAG